MSLLTNLISYWKLDEAAGADGIDAHGSNTLTDHFGDCGSAAGMISTSRTFIFAARYLSHADNASLSTGDIDFTVACWAYGNSFGGGDEIISKWKTGGNLEYLLRHSGTSFQFLVSSDGSAVASVTWSGTPSTATWYHIVAWHDSVANTINIQVNNGAVDTVSHSAGVFDSTEAFYIGGADTIWNGRIDETAFWKRVLTTQERTDLYNSGAGLAYPLTVAAAGNPWYAYAQQ